MSKKIMVGIIIGVITTSVFAKSSMDLITFSKNTNRPIKLWSIDDEGPGFYTSPSEPNTIIIHNRQTRTSNSLTSDPIRVDCNGTPIIVHAGASFTCDIPAKGKFVVSSEPGFFKNGAEGVLVDLGTFH